MSSRPDKHYAHYYDRRTAKHPALSHVILEKAVGPRPDGLIARHLNDDSLDNRRENLAWGTWGDNARDAVRNGRRSRLYGERNGRAKLTAVEVEEIREHLRRGDTMSGVAMAFGVSRIVVWQIAKGLKWRDSYDGVPIRSCRGPKLTWHQVEGIRRRLAAGESQRSIARACGVDPSTIFRIAHRIAWRDERGKRIGVAVRRAVRFAGWQVSLQLGVDWPLPPCPATAAGG
jgi:hypothetical protein